jgi:hypothetical protein
MPLKNVSPIWHGAPRRNILAELFAQTDPTQWQIALDILQSAVEYWEKTNTPMTIIIVKKGGLLEKP